MRIGARNTEAIRSSSLLAASLEGQELDSGTAAELGFGSALGIPCYGVRSDLRQSGEPGSPVNLQVHAFVLQSGGQIAGTLGELVGMLAAFVGR